MKIKKIISFDNETKEADILISDGDFELIVYAHPLSNLENIQNFVIIPFLTKNVIKSEKKEFAIIKDDKSFYSYHITGKIKSKSKGIITIGNIRINEFTDFPGDLKDGDFINFNCLRFDLINI